MIKLPVIFDRYTRKKDRSYSLTFVTALEVGKENREAIDSDWQKEGWLVFAENGISEVAIPKEPAEVGEKSRSERLRNVLYRLWESKFKTGYTPADFTTFYNSRMDKWIEDLKEKID